MATSKNDDPNIFAETYWTIGDILAIRPKMEEHEAEEFLNANERQILDDMISRGWESIETLLDLQGYTVKEFGETDGS